MISRNFYIPTLILFLSVFSVFGQTRKQLEAQRIKLNKEIEQVNTLLFKEKKKEKNALDDLNDLNRKIAVRAKLIAAINSEKRILSKEIRANETNLNILNKKLADLKEDYAAIILKSYKSKSQQSKTMFLLSSQNFYQAYKRLEYLKQYTAYRQKQSKDIVHQTSVIRKLNDSLVFQKTMKNTLISSETQQKKEIETDKKEQEKLITAIKKKENKYKRSLRKKIKAERKVAAKIDKIIREAIAKANKNLKNKPTSAKKNEFILSPEAKALATKFELNKGVLPWPVKAGLVTRKFGIQKHPTIGGITLNSTGLHINTKKGVYAESIFNGEVLTIQLTSEGRKNILVRHGSYITAYKNLETTLVKVGDKVKTGQKLGKIFTDKVTGKTKLIFVLFKNTERLNPASWILKR